MNVKQLAAQVAALEAGYAAQTEIIAKLTTRIAHLEAARPYTQRELPLPSNRRVAMQAAKEEAMRTGKSVLVA